MPQPRIYPSAAARQAAFRQRAQQARLEELAAKGLPALPRVTSLPGTARWRALLEQAQTLLETAATEMQDYWDDRSEVWQEGDRAEQMAENIDAIQQIAGSITEVAI
jgi:hypothetical protein